jgi:hypothetical protein
VVEPQQLVREDAAESLSAKRAIRWARLDQRRVMAGFKDFKNAAITIAGIDNAERIRRSEPRFERPER